MYTKGRIGPYISDYNQKKKIMTAKGGIGSFISVMSLAVASTIVATSIANKSAVTDLKNQVKQTGISASEMDSISNLCDREGGGKRTIAWQKALELIKQKGANDKVYHQGLQAARDSIANAAKNTAKHI